MKVDRNGQGPGQGPLGPSQGGGPGSAAGPGPRLQPGQRGGSAERAGSAAAPADSGAAAPDLLGPAADRRLSALDSFVSRTLQTSGAASLPAAFVSELRGGLRTAIQARLSGPAIRDLGLEHVAWELDRETLWTSTGTTFTLIGGRLVIMTHKYGAGGTVIGYVVEEVIEHLGSGRLQDAKQSWLKLGPEFFRQADVPRLIGHVLRQSIAEPHRDLAEFASRLEVWLQSPPAPQPDAGGREAASLDAFLDEFGALAGSHPDTFVLLANVARLLLGAADEARRVE